MSKPTFISVFIAGDALLITPMAGWGGGYRETGEHHTTKLDAPDLATVFEVLMERSDIRLGAYEAGSRVPYAKIGYGRAAAMARRRGATLRCVNLFREGNTLTLQMLGPVPGERGLAPAGPREHPADLAEAVARIRALVSG